MGGNQTSWKPGQSGNPKGPPKKAQTLTDALRKHIDPNEIAKILQEMIEARDLGAIKYAYDRIDGRPVETVNQNVTEMPKVVRFDPVGTDDSDT